MKALGVKAVFSAADLVAGLERIYARFKSEALTGMDLEQAIKILDWLYAKVSLCPPGPQ